MRIMIILYIPLTSKEWKFQPQTSVFPEKNNPFSIKPTVVWVKISEKKYISFFGLISRYSRLANRKKLILPLERYFKILKDMISGTELFTILEVGEIMVANYRHLMGTQGAFPYKVTPDIDFTDEVVVQCDVPDITVVLVIYKWSQ